MNDALLNHIARYYSQDETLLLAGLTLLLGICLLLASNARSVVRHTLAYAALCFAANLGAGLLHASGSLRAAGVLHGLVLLGLGLGVIRLLGLLVFRVIVPRLPVAPPRILEDIVVMIGYLAWGLTLLSRTGLELSSIVTTSAVITAVIAFAMQDTLGNILGGLALQLDNSIEIGDWVKIDDVSGQVVDIRWRYTAIRTRNGEHVVIPNSQLMKGKVWLMGDRNSAAPLWRRSIHFNIGYVAQPARVIAAVEQAVREAEIANVAKEPLPNCVLLEFGPGYGHYALRYWLSNPAHDDPTDSAVRAHIFAAIKRAGWRFALPEELRHLVKENTAFRSEIKQRELQRRVEALRSIPLFAELSDDERFKVAEHMVYAPFAAGDVLTRQGAVAHWLYIIISGCGEVVRELPDGHQRSLALLDAGEVFGEMGLLTGEPRTATVFARTDMECYRLDKSGLQEIMQNRPAIAEALSQVLANRLQHNEHLQENESKPATIDRASLAHAVFGKIRTFFNLQ